MGFQFRLGLGIPRRDFGKSPGLYWFAASLHVEANEFYQPIGILLDFIGLLGVRQKSFHEAVEHLSAEAFTDLRQMLRKECFAVGARHVSAALRPPVLALLLLQRGALLLLTLAAPLRFF